MKKKGDDGTTRRGEEELIGEIVAEALDRRRAGEMPSAGEYAARHPELAEAIERHFRVVDLLESARARHDHARQDEAQHDGALKDDSKASLAAGSCDLATAVAELPLPSQRLIFLRHFERLPWPAIAERLGEPEEALRRRHAATLRTVIERCHGWLCAPPAEPGR